MPQYVFQLRAVGKIVPLKTNFEDISRFSRGRRSILGLNGAGKSTLLKIMAV